MGQALPDIPASELSAVVRAVRAAGRDRAMSTRDQDLRIATLAFAMILAGILHVSPSRAWNSPQAHFRAEEELKMFGAMRTLAMSSSLIATSGALAQNAVEWRVQDGGNGHWYQPVYEFVSAPAARDAAIARGGHLATFLSAEENAFVAALGLPYSQKGVLYGYWIGGVRSQSSGAWTWVTGEPWQFTNFDIPEPNGCCGADVRFLVMRAHPGHEGRWDDTSTNGNWDGTPMPFLVEYDADCNNDGVVDFGQIRSGQLADINANGVPDSCEPADCNGNQLSDQSEILSGRAFDANFNGVIDSCEGTTPLPVLRSVGINRNSGGQMCGWWTTAPFAGIWDVWVSRTSAEGPWLNGAASAGGSLRLEAELQPGLNTLFMRHEFNGCTSTAWGAGLWFEGTRSAQIRIAPGNPCTPFDGLLNSTLDQSDTVGGGTVTTQVGGWTITAQSFTTALGADLVGPEVASPSGAPDIVTTIKLFVKAPCPGDITRNGTVDGVDLALVLSTWGTNGAQGAVDCDLNDDGTVNGMDLAIVLSGWGACQ